MLRALLVLLACAPLSLQAANTPRHSHTASLMPTGNMLIVGGVGAGGVPIATAEIRLTARDGTAVDATSMGVARASHTATVLSNGRVLVTGGWNGGVTVLNTAQVYDPSANSWSATGNNMSAARFNHTATVLDSGLVLICGGQIDFTPTVTATCDTYNPTTNMFTPTVGNMQQGRAAHTATLLKNGRVWFAGGWNPGVNPTYLFTTERYDPAFGTFNSAAPLAQGRAFHTATMGGDGKVLIAGGLNSDNAAVNGNSFGFLPTVQIYDPVGNSMSPAAAMNTRRAMHATVLSSDGHIRVMGGLGNVATTYVLSEVTGNLLSGSNVTANFIPPTDYLTTGTISGGSLSLGLDFQLGTPVTGVIDDGEIVLSSPSVTFQDVQILFVSGNPDNAGVGLRIPLTGVAVGCNDPFIDAETSCGRITGNLSMSNLQGKLHTTPGDLQLSGLAPPAITAGTLSFAPTPIADGDISPITGGNFTVTMDIFVNPAFIGFSISSGSIILATASIVKPTSMTATLDGGFGTFTSGVIVPSVDGTRGVATITVTFSNLSGEVLGDTAASAVASPQSITGLQVTNLTGIVRLVPTGVDLTDRAFVVNQSTVVIRRMSFGSPEFYRPDVNAWDWVPPNGTAAVGSAFATIGPTATLMPNNDIVFWGGRQTMAGAPLTSQSRTLAFTGWSSPPTPKDGGDGVVIRRALHTATVLPNGLILLAGGTNGPNILRTAELFDPGVPEFTDTLSPMHDARDLHTATLLPNGRVLMAGGFTTNATSTGSTSTSEIYYPDTNLFLQAAPMISSRSNHTAVLLPDGNVLAAGGFGDNDVITATTEIYYSTAGFWRAAPSMPTARTLHTATLLNDGRVVVAGGLNSGGVLSSVHAFNTLTGTWAALAAMPIALHSHSATRLFDGRILVAGGNNGLGEQDVSMIYDPSANTWTNTVLIATSALTMPRFGHNSTLLPNGNVMISGGTQRFGQITDIIEVFHSPIGAWADHGRFSTVRRAYHTMTLAPDGRLYALGGSDGTIGGVGTQLLNTIETSHLSTTPDDVSVAGEPGFRRSTITATSGTPFLPNTLFTVVGTQFKGGTEASGGGAAAANSSFSYPRLTLQSIDGGGGAATQGQSGFIVDLTTQIYLNAGNLATLNSSVTVQLPATNAGLPYGWYGARVSANDIHSPARLVQVGPAKPTAAPGSVLGIPVGTSSMSWTWTAVPGADGYAIYQTTTGVFLGTTAVTTYIQDGMAPNTTASILVAGYTITGDGPLAQGATNFTLCTSPTNVTIASVTFTNLLLHWNTNGNEPGTIYEIQQSTDNFVTSLSTPVPLALQVTTNSYTLGSLLQNTTYSFRVRGYNGAGNPGPFSLAVSTLTRAPVGGLDGAALSPTSIRWVWNNPGATVNVIEYRVYNATTGVLISVVPPAVNPEYIDSPLGFNEARSVMVSAVTSAGEGPLTPSPTYFTLAQPPSLAPLPYLLPITATQLTGMWTFSGNPSHTDYRYRLFEVGGATAPVGGTFDLGTQISSYTINGLTPATLYVGSVTAINGNDIESSWLVLGATYTLANRPILVTVPAVSPVSLDVSWDTNGNGAAATYELTYSTDPLFGPLYISTFIPFSANFAGSSTTITGLLTSTTYYLRVRAQTPFGAQTAYSDPQFGFTFNGGAPAGSIAGTLSSLSPSQIVGSLGNGRQIEVRSPAGAFPSDVTMTISSYNVAGTLCPNGVNVAVSITNAPALQPLKPIFLSLSYTAGEIGAIPLNRLTLFRYEPVSGTCVPLETTASGGIARAQINHFSLFQLGQTTLATTPEAARIFPNPFRTASDSYLTIDNVPAGSRVRIFTLRGELVTDMLANASGIATWAANNGSGRAVASGLYLVMVESGSKKKILKLSVLR